MGKIRTILTIIVLVAVWCLISFLFIRDMQRDKQESQRELDALGQTVYFEGTVIASPVYKNTTLLCVRIIKSSVDSFYHFSRYCAVKIQDGLAVLPIGLIDENSSSDLFKSHAQRVVVNRDYNNKIYYITGNDTLTEELSFWSGKLEEVHMLMAWENSRDYILQYFH